MSKYRGTLVPLSLMQVVGREAETGSTGTQRRHAGNQHESTRGREPGTESEHRWSPPLAWATGVPKPKVGSEVARDD
jgi:hypothetical protein